MKTRLTHLFGALALSLVVVGCGGGGIEEGTPEEIDQAQIDAEFREMMSKQGEQMEKNAATVAQ